MISQAPFMLGMGFFRDRAFCLSFLQAAVLLAAFAAAAGFNGTSDPLLAVFMPLLCLLAGTLLWSGIKEGWRIPVSPVALLLALLWLWLATTTLWSSVPYISTMFAVLIGCLPLAFFMITMARQPETTCRALAAAIACGWLWLAVWALLQFTILPDTKGQRISGPMLDPNNMAALFNMGMLPAAAWYLAARTRMQTGAALAAYILLLAATMVTMSRAGLVIALAGLVLLAVLESRPALKRWWKLPVYAAVPPFVYLLVNGSSGDRFGHTFTDLAHPDRSPSINDRHALLEGSLRMLKSHPFGDIGLGNFYYFYPAFRSPKDMSDGYFAHNDPLQLMLETGLPTALLLYAFLIAVLVRTVRAWIRLPADGTARTIMTASFTALLALIVHSHINYNLYMPGILIPAGVLLAVWYNATEKAAGMDTRRTVAFHSPLVRKLAVGAMAAAVATVALWSLQTGLTAYYLNAVNREIQAGNGDKAALLLDRVARFGNRRNFSVHEARARLSMQLFNQAQDASGEERAKVLRQGMKAISEARRLNPPFTAFMSTQAQFYFIGNDLAFPGGIGQAESLLEDAVRLNPLDVDSREGLSVVYGREGRKQDALRILNEGLNWPRPKGQPDLAYLMITARAHREAGDEAGYQSLMDLVRQRAQIYGLPFQPL